MCVRLWFFLQAEDGIRDLVRSRGLGDVYKRQHWCGIAVRHHGAEDVQGFRKELFQKAGIRIFNRRLSLIHI